MKIEFKFKNGQKVKDIVSGLSGIIECSSMWLNGCVRYSVQPKIKKGQITKPEAWWMDEEQLNLIDEGVNKKVIPSKTGGPSMRSDSARRQS